MPTRLQKLSAKLLKWRYKHVSQRNFILLLSILVGLLAGLVALTLKNITFAIEAALENGIIFSQNQLYFILPFVGLFLVYLFVCLLYTSPSPRDGLLSR